MERRVRRFVIELYKDLLLAGSGIEGIEGSWDEGMRRARQSTYKAWSLKGRLDREMDQASTEFRQAGSVREEQSRSSSGGVCLDKTSPVIVYRPRLLIGDVRSDIA